MCIMFVGKGGRKIGKREKILDTTSNTQRNPRQNFPLDKRQRKSIIEHRNCITSLRGLVKFHTGGKAREHTGAESVRFRCRQYSLDERR